MGLGEGHPKVDRLVAGTGRQCPHYSPSAVPSSSK